MKERLHLIQFLFLLLTCVMINAGAAESVTIAAAANLQGPATELKQDFNKVYPAIDVIFVFGASGKLANQITKGAPFDIFISADMKFPQLVRDNGSANGPVLIYARGYLVLMTIKNIDISEGLFSVKNPNIKKIAIANPKLAPYGAATIDLLKHEHLLEIAESKFVVGESMSQTVQMTILGADVGFIAKSMVYSEELKKMCNQGLKWIDIDPSLYPPIDQGMVILKKGAGKKEARLFFDYMSSERARDILSRYGYGFR